MSDRKASIARDAVIRMGATGLLYVQNVALLILIGNRLGAVAYGTWGQIVAALGLLIPLLTANLGRACLRSFPSAFDTGSLRRGFYSMFFFVFLVALGGVGLGLLSRAAVSLWLFGGEGAGAQVPLVLAFLFARTLTFFVRSYFQGRNQIARYSVLEIASLTGQIVAVVALSYGADRFTLNSVLMALTAIESVVLVVMLWLIVRDIGWPSRLSPTLVIEHLRFSLPLIPNLMLLWVINSSDRFVITHSLGLDQAGLYTAAYQLGRLMNVFMIPIAFGFFPVAARMWDQGERPAVSRYMGKALQYYAMIAMPSAVGMICIGPSVLYFLGGVEFDVSHSVIGLLVLGVFAYATNQISGYAINLSRRTRVVVPVSLAAAGLNLGMNLWLVPRWGLLAAALSTFLAFTGRAIALILICRKEVVPRVSPRVFMRIGAASLCMYPVLRFIPITSPLWIAVAILCGAVVYASAALLLGVVGREELALLRSVYRRIGRKEDV